MRFPRYAVKIAPYLPHVMLSLAKHAASRTTTAAALAAIAPRPAPPRAPSPLSLAQGEGPGVRAVLPTPRHAEPVGARRLAYHAAPPSATATPAALAATLATPGPAERPASTGDAATSGSSAMPPTESRGCQSGL